MARRGRAHLTLLLTAAVLASLAAMGAGEVPAEASQRGLATVMLTIDDGPSPYTQAMLNLLAAHHVRAVFCLVGFRAGAYPWLVREERAAGHVLCDHTQTHDLYLGWRSAGVVHWQISQGFQSIVVTSGGVTPRLFRAPGGSWSRTVLAEVWAEHMTPLYWTDDPWDWSRPGVNAIVSRVLWQLRPGGIILLHDAGGDRSQTVAALRILLDVIPRLGYRFVVPAV